MITAKDIFSLERETIAELNFLLYNSNLSHEERDALSEKLNGITEAEYFELEKMLRNRQINDLDRLRNGETLSAAQINNAVKLAAKNE